MTDIVKLDDARRAGKPDECFYCKQSMGERHLDECVILQKKVRVRFTIEFDHDTVRSWDKEMIEFHLNDSSWCMSNAIPQIIAELQRIDETDGECLCRSASAEYLAPAPENDA